MSQEKSVDNPIPTGPLYVNPNKKYGLIIPNKKSNSQLLTKPIQTQKPVVKPCIFDDEDDDLDEDETSNKKNPKKPISNYQVNTNSNLLKKQTQIEIEKALKEDKNVFEYDAIYDELEKEKEKLNPKQKQKNESKEPKYIVGIMKAAAKRKMEYEKIQERKIHKEREAEGDLWSDKEVFVTTAYRQKMEERQKIEEEERRQEEIENLLDVRKQKDLSGFYYSLLKMKSGEMVIEEEGEKEKRLEMEKLEQEKIKFKEKAKSSKIYRSKKEDEESESEEEIQIKEEIEKQIDTVNENEFKEPEIKKAKSDTEQKENENPIVEAKSEPVDKEEVKNVKKLTKEEERKIRLENLFKKRTVGDKFDQELADYFVRKSQILSEKNYIEREN